MSSHDGKTKLTRHEAIRLIDDMIARIDQSLEDLDTAEATLNWIIREINARTAS